MVALPAGPSGVWIARVNGATLIRYNEQPVSLLATVIKADGGQAFQVKSSDGKQITVRMKGEPLNDVLTGLIEVYGTGRGSSLIMCDSYTSFPERISSTFDMTQYNEVLTLLAQSDNPWMLTIGANIK